MSPKKSKQATNGVVTKSGENSPLLSNGNHYNPHTASNWDEFFRWLARSPISQRILRLLKQSALASITTNSHLQEIAAEEQRIFGGRS